MNAFLDPVDLDLQHVRVIVQGTCLDRHSRTVCVTVYGTCRTHFSRTYWVTVYCSCRYSVFGHILVTQTGTRRITVRGWSVQ